MANNPKDLKLRSRLPTGSGSDQLTMLSPKTPQLGVNMPDFNMQMDSLSLQPLESLPGFTNTQLSYQQGFNSYGNYGQDFTNGQNSGFCPYPMNSSSPPQPMPNSGFMQNFGFGGPNTIMEHGNGMPPANNMAPKENSYGTKQSTVLSTVHPGNYNALPYPNVQQTVATTSVPPVGTVGISHESPARLQRDRSNLIEEQRKAAKKRGRKTTMSLNPEEREALENLVEEMIIGGLGSGLIDSESEPEIEESKSAPEFSSSDEQDDGLTGQLDGSKKEPGPMKGGENSQKVYPPQLKVAVKHMKNLPPRFLRKIQSANKDFVLIEDVKSDGEIEVKSRAAALIKETEEYTAGQVKAMEAPPLTGSMLMPPGIPAGKVRNKEEQKLIQKKILRGMIQEGLEHYLLDQSGDSDDKKNKATPTSSSPGDVTPSNGAQLPPNNHTEPPPPPPIHDPAIIQLQGPAPPPEAVLPPKGPQADMHILQPPPAAPPPPFPPNYQHLMYPPSNYGQFMQPQPSHKMTNFSVDAPEFVPRSATYAVPPMGLPLPPNQDPRYMLPPNSVCAPPPHPVSTVSTAPIPGTVQGPGGIVYAPVSNFYGTPFAPQQFPQMQRPFLVAAWSGMNRSTRAPLPTGLQGLITYRGRPSQQRAKTSSPAPVGVTPQQAKERVQGLLKQKKKVMVILRGLPGSGKTTIAREAVLDGVILSTDDFFMGENGAYNHSWEKLSEAHEWNQKRAREALAEGKTPIIIDNTNSQFWEMKIYVLMAMRKCYHVEIMEPSTPWKFKISELLQKNQHKLPLETLQKMHDRYERNATVDRIVGRSKFEPTYKTDDTGEEGEKKVSRRRRRRRRRRRKRLETERGSDEEQSSEDEQTDDSMVRLRTPESSMENSDYHSLNSSLLETSTSSSVSTPDAPTVKLGIKPPKDDVSLTLSPILEEGRGGHQSAASPVIRKLDFDQDAGQKSKGLKQKADGKEARPTENGNKERAAGKRQESEPGKLEDGTVSGEIPSKQPVDSDKLHELKVKTNCDNSNVKKEQVMARNGYVQHGAAEKNEGEPSGNMLLSPTEISDASEEFVMVEKEMLDSNEVKNEETESRKSELAEGEEIVKLESSGDQQADGVIGASSSKDSLKGIENKNGKFVNSELVSSVLSIEVTSTLLVPDEATTNQNEGKDLGTTNQNESKKATANWNEDKDLGTANQNEVKKDLATANDSESNKSLTTANQSEGKDLATANQNEGNKDLTNGIAGQDHTSKLPFAEENLARSKKTAEKTGPPNPPSVQRLFSQTKNAGKGMPPNVPSLSEVERQYWSGGRSDEDQYTVKLEPRSVAITRAWSEPKEQRSPRQRKRQNAASPVVAPMYKEIRTNTDPRDFSLLQRVQAGALVELGRCTVKDTHPRNFQPVLIFDTVTTPGHKQLLHSSAQTDANSRDYTADLNQKIGLLQDVMPTAPFDSCLDLLYQCRGDVDWALNILLDSPPIKLLETQPRFPRGEKLKGESSSSISESEGSEPQGAAANLPRGASASLPLPISPQKLTDLCHLMVDSLPLEALDWQVEHGVKSLQIEGVAAYPPTPDRATEDEHLNEAAAAAGPVVFSVTTELTTQDPPHTPDPPITTDPRQSCPDQPEKDEESVLLLHLTKPLAAALNQLFSNNPSKLKTDTLTPGDLEVGLDLNLAQQIFNRWRKTQKVKRNDTKGDEELARRLQEAEGQGHQQQKRRGSSHSARSSPAHQAKPAPTRTASLREIMREEQLEQKLSPARSLPQFLHSPDLATKMKLQQLNELFPDLDQEVVCDLFRENGCSLDKTIDVIENLRDDCPPPKNVMTENFMAQNEEQMLRQAILASLAEAESNLGKYDEFEVNQTAGNETYQNLRAEAQRYYELRRVAIHKGSLARNKKLQGAAWFFSQQINVLSQKLKEANERAAECILQSRQEQLRKENTLDLHGFHIREAVKVLRQTLQSRAQGSGRNHIYVVTGRGKHSSYGVSKLKPAVLNYLQHNKYKWSETKPGSLKVNVRPDI